MKNFPQNLFLVFLPFYLGLDSIEFSSINILTAIPKGVLKTILQPETFLTIKYGWLYYFFITTLISNLILFYFNITKIYIYFITPLIIFLSFKIGYGALFCYVILGVFIFSLSLQCVYHILISSNVHKNKYFSSIYLSLVLLIIPFAPHINGIPDRVTFPASAGITILIIVLSSRVYFNKNIMFKKIILLNMIFLGAFWFVGQTKNFKIFSPNNYTSLYHTLIWKPKKEVFNSRKFSNKMEHKYYSDLQNIVKKNGGMKKIKNENITEKAFEFSKINNTSLILLGVKKNKLPNYKIILDEK